MDQNKAKILISKIILRYSFNAMAKKQQNRQRQADFRFEKSLVIWRNTKEKPNKERDRFFLKQKYSTQDFEFDKIFVNRDNNLENLKVAEDKWKVSLIEEEFKKRMFDAKDV